MGRPRLPFELTGHLSAAAQARALRRAHAQAESYRYIRRRPPEGVAALEREYWRWRGREQRKARHG